MTTGDFTLIYEFTPLTKDDDEDDEVSSRFIGTVLCASFAVMVVVVNFKAVLVVVVIFLTVNAVDINDICLYDN